MTAKQELEAAIVIAVRRMSVLRYFPADQIALKEIMAILARIASHPKQLDWLVTALVDGSGEWPGPGQLRALFATRFRPADGNEGPPCTLAGYTPDDGEAQSIAAHEEVKRLEVASLNQIAAHVDHDAIVRELEAGISTAAKQLKPIIAIGAEDRLLSEAWARKRGL